MEKLAGGVDAGFFVLFQENMLPFYPINCFIGKETLGAVSYSSFPFYLPRESFFRGSLSAASPSGIDGCGEPCPQAGRQDAPKFSIACKTERFL
ncbi:MAG: hypothetical protein LBG14_03750 [Treponema sp.]|jgi:hypothetical protein|nr:hypothetical protein [Treponema sp.]